MRVTTDHQSRTWTSIQDGYAEPVTVGVANVKLYGPIPPPYRFLDHGLMLTTEETERLAEILTAAATQALRAPASD